MAEANPVILVFEDLQWADGGLLDFIDYLLEWSAEFPIFVLGVGRPELRERRPSWEALSLEPLEPAAVRACWMGWRRACPVSWLGRSWGARKGSRCTRWKRFGCSRTAVCSCRRAPGMCLRVM
jgi:hypothetical protein